MKGMQLLSVLLLMPPMFCLGQELPEIKLLGKIEVDHINPELTQSRRDLGKLHLFHKDGNFGVAQSGKYYDIQNHNVDKELRNISKENLEGMLENGYIKIDQNSNKEFTLQGMPMLRGGGPLLARAGYWVTKSLCWGVVGAGFSTGAAQITGSGLFGAALAKSGTSWVLGGKGATYAANLINGAKAVKTAQTVATATYTTAGGGWGLSLAIESASTGVWAWLMTLPTP